MTPPTVERLAPAFLGVLGAHPLKRQLRLLHAQALQRFPPEEVCGGRSLLMFRRGLDAMDEAPGFCDDGGAIGLRGKDPGGTALLRPAFVLPFSVTSQETPSRVSPSSNALKMN